MQFQSFNRGEDCVKIMTKHFDPFSETKLFRRLQKTYCKIVNYCKNHYFLHSKNIKIENTVETKILDALEVS